jgi:hypothetical protein
MLVPRLLTMNRSALHSDTSGMLVTIALLMLNEVAQQRYHVRVKCVEHMILDKDHMHSNTS